MTLAEHELQSQYMFSSQLNLLFVFVRDGTAEKLLREAKHSSPSDDVSLLLRVLSVFLSLSLTICCSASLTVLKAALYH